MGSTHGTCARIRCSFVEAGATSSVENPPEAFAVVGSPCEAEP